MASTGSSVSSRAGSKDNQCSVPFLGASLAKYVMLKSGPARFIDVSASIMIDFFQSADPCGGIDHRRFPLSRSPAAAGIPCWQGKRCQLILHRLHHHDVRAPLRYPKRSRTSLRWSCWNPSNGFSGCHEIARESGHRASRPLRYRCRFSVANRKLPHNLQPTAGDFRTTVFGVAVAKTSMDELPQFHQRAQRRNERRGPTARAPILRS